MLSVSCQRQATKQPETGPTGKTMNATTQTQLQRANAELRRAREQLARYGEALAEIQRSILPQRFPEVPGLDLAVHFADIDRVGGDFYDVHPVGPHRWAIVVADVSGHGLAAAAILAVVHALGNAVDRHRLQDPGAALAAVNGPLASRYLANTGKFVTAFAALYDAQAQELTYASAGHPPPRLVRGKEIRRLNSVAGLPLGIDQTAAYDEASVQLQPGDRLVLFTDGITESANPANEFLGNERLDALLSAPTSTAAELLGHIVNCVRAFRGERPPDDDETCLVAVVNPVQPGKRPVADVRDDGTGSTPMESTQELATRLDAAFASMEAKRRQLREFETRKCGEWKKRFATLGVEFDTLRQILKPRLDLLIEKFGNEITATPKLTQATRELLLELHSEVARIRLRFQGTTDHDIRKLILTYDLEIIPTLLQFETHSTLEMPLDAIDYEAAVRWADERIISFVQIHSALHENPYCLLDRKAADSATGTAFPNLAAGAKIECDCQSSCFVSEQTLQGFRGLKQTAARLRRRT